MPLIPMPEYDIFRYDNATLNDILVIPVNLIGATDFGIMEELVKKHPSAGELYKNACAKKTLHIGDVLVYDPPQVSVKIVFLPTKRHYMDGYDPGDLKKALTGLREYLKKPENHNLAVAMPMLGDNSLKEGRYDVSYTIFSDYLGHLTNPIVLCMLPQYLTTPIQYLGIIGPRVFGVYPASLDEALNVTYLEQYQVIEDGMLEACEFWDKRPESFRSFVSGGAKGVDTVACGSSLSDPSYERSLAFKYSPRKPIIYPANWEKHGKTAAGFVRNTRLVNIVTHLVGIRPLGVQSNGTAHAIRTALSCNDEIQPDDLRYTHVYVVGDKDVSSKVTKRIMI